MKKQGHPPGLFVLSTTEMWERFAFYGMRALLVLYLVNQLEYERADALSIYGMYLGLVYLTPMLGGYLADKYLGKRKAIFIGGLTMAMGQLALAFEPFLFVGLGLMIAGNGFFKPNISTIVSSLYKKGDKLVDAAFTIFYMFINLGAFFSPLICGTIGEKIGWGWGFASASVGMICGLVTFHLFRRHLGTAGLPPRCKGTGETQLAAKDFAHIAIWVISNVAIVAITLGAWKFIGPYWTPLALLAKLAIILVAVVFVFVINGWRNRRNHEYQPFTQEEIHRLAVLFVVCFFVMFFWMGFEQAGGTMNLFAEANTDRLLSFGGDPTDEAAYWQQTDTLRAEYARAEEQEREMEITLSEALKKVEVPKGFWLFPATWFQSVNPMFIFMLAPLFSMMWMRWDKSRRALSTPAKMGWGMIILGIGFLIMWGAQNSADSSIRAGIWWLLAVYFFHTMGELFLSPIGLSLVTKLSPARVVSTMMGVWFASAAVADYLAQRMEEIVHHAGWPLWQTLIATSCGGGIALLCITPLLKKWMHGRG